MTETTNTTPPAGHRQLSIETVLGVLGGVTEADVIRFLTACKADPSCPSCRANTWTFLDPKETGVLDNRVRHASFVANAFGGGHLLPAVVMTCNQCGFIRQHSGHLVAQWWLSDLA